MTPAAVVLTCGFCKHTGPGVVQRNDLQSTLCRDAIACAKRHLNRSKPQ